ncbi:ABC transporter ATP-binding protein [Pseudogracilibacillus sp. ICA-222130]|uniref:ABC transporter ATP-binding protein n=1 Tax=Pseudogracilibacillus sp. ICA-222130 TaxID=3134655 RepID=UPI0030C48097
MLHKRVNGDEHANGSNWRETKRPLVTIENFSFAYESLEEAVLRELDVTLYENEVTLLMGPSGSGKSTLSLCLNGLYPEAVEGETAGSIRFRGEHLQDSPAGTWSKQIGVVFQDPEAQFCMIHVADELAFTLENMAIKEQEMDEKIDEVLLLVGMEKYKHRKLHELSGGEKQKIALAAVLLLEPTLLILDEATVNLDPHATESFINLIQHIQEERQMSVFIIDHQADAWLNMTDRVLLLGKNGRLLQDASPEEMFTTYKAQVKEAGIFIPKKFSSHSFGACLYTRSSTQNRNEAKDAETVMRLEHVTYKRKTRTILKQIHMDIPKGAFISILGRNGAGKSTLLELMAGIIPPTKGKVYFQHRPLQKWKETKLRQQLGFVFQNPEHQFITDTVYDELVFSMRLNEEPREKMEATATYLLEHFQLESEKYRNPFSLSGGQKRRLSVATALDDTPDMLLFDEPTFGQDAETTARLIHTIFELREKGITIMIVTHDMDLAAISDMVYVLHEGEIAYHGAPDTLWEQEDLLRAAHLRRPLEAKYVRQKVGEIG